MTSSALRRKINTFRVDPIGSTKDKVQTLLPRITNQWGKKRLAESGALDILLEFLSARPPSGFSPDFADLWFLYQKVRRRRPRIIFEFGSGCSTVILAKALFDNKNSSHGINGYLYSIDADPYWEQSTRASIPASLKDCCEVVYSPVLETEYDGILSFRHSRIPDVSPDFVYLDGPPLTAERQVAIDILDMEDRFSPGFFLVVDGRKENTKFLKQYLKRRYRFRDRKLFFNSVFTLVS